ncbi:DinB family protein [Pedobacter sp. L105]|uniref:DinB family protein n=1 Tax=Pedobacter sp. L105 TaxID=1641871 RepID=UPI00131B0B8C|nr:DinB family protein [Pedobacter sp. L105]
MILETLIILFTRDLQRLYKEIDSYNDESNIWKIDGGISNSAGNLCLHLVGNLNTYIGRELGKIEYVRNRELEFSIKDVPKSELLEKIDETISIVSSSLSKLTREELDKEYPIMIFDTMTSTEYLLVHLTTHLTYHLGQINYHRRLLDQ